MSSVDRAKALAEERNSRWQDAWTEWDMVTYVDMIIAKCKRALNCLDVDVDNIKELEKNTKHLEDSIMDALNYAKRLKEVLKDASL